MMKEWFVPPDHVITNDFVHCFKQSDQIISCTMEEGEETVDKKIFDVTNYCVWLKKTGL